MKLLTTGQSSSELEFKIGHVEHQVKNRDLILDVIENRLARLESDKKKGEESDKK